jgi:tripartite-type tricarboxylate transporter receptor subunit TctC
VKLRRRQFLHLAAGAASLSAVPRIARAQTYPTRPVRFIVPFSPGGTTDIVARLLGQWLSEHFHQPFVVENRPGANGSIATETVVRSAADGYTLVMLNTGTAINATLYNNLNFDLVRDIAPVASIFHVSFVMANNLSDPAKTVPELIAYAKANPGKINMASGENGSPSHVFGELFKLMAGVDMLRVPYRGEGPALVALLGGQAQLMFAPVPASIAYVQAGKLRALAVTTATRVKVLPDVPTVGDFVPGYEASSWQGIGAPKNTPAEIVGTLNVAVNMALADPAIAQRLADLGGVLMPMAPAAFGKLIAEDTEKWGKVIRAANIKVE